MLDYDFKSLNDKEFEALVVDLLSSDFGVRIERFKPGKDKGVDGRFYALNGDEVIIQSKHYIKSGYKLLLKKLIDEELGKVKKLGAKRYIIATSIELSRFQKNEIATRLAPYIIRPDDIYGAEDLNSLLKKYSKIEENYYKLWLSSTNVMKIIYNSAIKGRSKDLIENATNDKEKYVVTDNHILAVSKLANNNVLILTGAPGIGKTTLASELCLYYAAKEYEVVCIEGDITEAEAVYDESKQIFYFDDFLGSNYLTALNNREDTHILRFIRRVQKDPNKKFILTSRTNILNQAKRISDKFNIENIDKDEMEVEVNHINRYDKSKILYNHIYFSDLNTDLIDVIYNNNGYLKIVDHKNYNPRLIQFITDNHKITNISCDKYWEFITSTFNNPVKVWENVYDSQLDELCRLMLGLVVVNEFSIDENTFNEAYSEIVNDNKGYITSLSCDFISMVKTLVGAVLNRNMVGNKTNYIRYTLFNPSVGDYVIKRISTDKNRLQLLYNSLNTVESIDNLLHTFRNKLIGNDIFNEILIKLVNKIKQPIYNDKYADYKIRVLNLLFISDGICSEEKKITVIIDAITGVSFTNLSSKYNSNTLRLLSYVSDNIMLPDLNNNIHEYITSIISDLIHEDYVTLTDMVYKWNIDCRDDVIHLLNESIYDYWQDQIDTVIKENGIISDIYDYDECDVAEALILEMLNNMNDYYSIRLDHSQINSIVRRVQVEDIISDNITRAAKDDYDSEWHGYKSNDYDDNSIIDLFQR